MSETSKKTLEQVLQLALDNLHPSPWNRPERSGFDEKSMSELAASIREQGIIEPLVVRKNAKGYEIVCGERRWTAAKIAKLPTVPCIVRDLDDNGAKKIQIIENLQREGLHPVEEAKGYADLLEQKDKDGKSINNIASIAKDIGKSAAFVYGRIQLLKMPKVALDASFTGKLNASNALLISRIPNPKQALAATLEILDPYGSSCEEKERIKRALDDDIEPMSYRKAKEHIQNKYMIRLKGSPFDQEDEELVPIEAKDGERLCGGKCSDCPFRTGNMKALFQDVESNDVCTNTDCYKAKKNAAFKKASAKAKAQGHTLLKDESAARLFTSDGELCTDKYVDVKATFPGGRKSWEDILGEHLPDSLVQARDGGRKMHFLIPVKDALEAAEKAGRKPPKEFVAVAERAVAAAVKPDPEEQKRQAEERQKQTQRSKAIALTVAQAVFDKAAATKPTANWWRWVVRAQLENNLGFWAQRFGCENVKALETQIEKATEDTLRAMLVTITFAYQPCDWEGKISPDLQDACEHYKVDAKKIREDKLAEYKAQDKAEAEKAEAEKNGKAKAEPKAEATAEAKAEAKK